MRYSNTTSYQAGLEALYINHSSHYVLLVDFVCHNPLMLLTRLNRPFDLPTLNTWHFVNTRNKKSRKKISRTAKFEVCSIGIWNFCSSLNIRNGERMCMQIPLPFSIFKLLPNFIFRCYRPQTWQFYLSFPVLFIPGTQKVRWKRRTMHAGKVLCLQSSLGKDYNGMLVPGRTIVDLRRRNE